VPAVGLGLRAVLLRQWQKLVARNLTPEQSVALRHSFAVLISPPRMLASIAKRRFVDDRFGSEYRVSRQETIVNRRSVFDKFFRISKVFALHSIRDKHMPSTC